MRILYGVNGVGNGHITRSRIMAKELSKAGHNVTYLFSGKEKDKYFDLEPFGTDVLFKKGLRFVIENGKVNTLKTIFNNDVSTFLRDIDDIDLTGYDLVISDFEPIVSWAARLQNKPCIGIGHQYSFDYDIPKENTNFMLNRFMRWYAPVDIGIGLHWHHFDSPIYPPIVEQLTSEQSIKNKILVYLAFEPADLVIDVLSKFPNHIFHVYGFDTNLKTPENVILWPGSKDGFLYDLRTCDGIICNSGFELISEALSIGKRVLAKPLIGQMEQHSNRLALEKLNYAFTTLELNYESINNFLCDTGTPIKKVWPNVAEHIVEWLPKYNTEELSLSIWEK
jgi:uncharacterized protein (TIGR00661 family)